MSQTRPAKRAATAALATPDRRWQRSCCRHWSPVTAADRGSPPAQPVSLDDQQPDGSTDVLSWQHAAAPSATTCRWTTTRASPAPRSRRRTVSNSYVPTVNLTPGHQYWRVQAVLRRSARARAGSRPRSSSRRGRGAGAGQPGQRRPPHAAQRPAAAALEPLAGRGDLHSSRSTATATSSAPRRRDRRHVAGRGPTRSRAATGSGASSPRRRPRQSGLQPSARQPERGPLVDIRRSPAPVLTSPPSDPDVELQDVVLDWEPVPGAVSLRGRGGDKHRLHRRLLADRPAQRHPRHALLAGDHLRQQPVLLARARLRHGRPTDAVERGAARLQPHLAAPRPTLVYPAAAGTEDVPAPLYFQWTSVPHASEYEIQVGTQENFSVGTYHSCRIAGTTYTPGMFAINSTGLADVLRTGERGLRARDRRHQLLARASSRPPVQQAGGVTSPASRASSPRPRPSSTPAWHHRHGPPTVRRSTYPRCRWDAPRAR